MLTCRFQVGEILTIGLSLLLLLLLFYRVHVLPYSSYSLSDFEFIPFHFV